ncbi:MAG TPA: nitroreductase [Azospira sp.]|nr:nitroreductase [Azospira sp.]
MNNTDSHHLMPDLAQLLVQRRTTRAYLPRPVSPGMIDEVLQLAARAPSGNNIQPWRVHVVSGEVRQRLVAAVCAAFDAADGSHREEYPYYPAQFFEPYLGRRRQTGWGLYGLLGIGKGDGDKMRAQQRRNFQFFGAPVGLMFTIDRRLAQGSWLDYGMFLQNVMLAAAGRGLGTCAQAAWNDYHRIIGEVLGFGEQEQLVCGMALGYADPGAPENGLVTARAALAEFVVRHGEGSGVGR